MELTEYMIDGIIHRHLEKPTHDELMDACRGKGGDLRSRSVVRKAFVYDLMCDVVVKRLKHNRSVNDVMLNREELRKVFNFLSDRGFKMLTDAVAKWAPLLKDEFELGRKLYESVSAGIRLFGKSKEISCDRPGDFPYAQCRELIRKYNTNGFMYDPSCGWGSRLCAAITEGVNYFGTDPNDRLVPRLEAMGNAMCEALGKERNFGILCQGSETKLKMLDGKFGLILTSPPYFDLEDYKYGEQSTKTFNTYDTWLQGYLEPTLRNCHDYLTNDGNCIINVKNYAKVNLFDDMLRIAERVGFKVKCYETLKNIKRLATNKEKRLNNDETCVVFGK